MTQVGRARAIIDNQTKGGEKDEASWPMKPVIKSECKKVQAGLSGTNRMREEREEEETVERERERDAGAMQEPRIVCVCY